MMRRFRRFRNPHSQLKIEMCIPEAGVDDTISLDFHNLPRRHDGTPSGDIEAAAHLALRDGLQTRVVRHERQSAAGPCRAHRLSSPRHPLRRTDRDAKPRRRNTAWPADNERAFRAISKAAFKRVQTPSATEI